MRRGDPPFAEIGQHHVGASESVHAPYPADDTAAKVNALAVKLKLQWCAQCQDFHEIAGGSEKARGAFAGGTDVTTVGGTDGI